MPGEGKVPKIIKDQTNLDFRTDKEIRESVMRKRITKEPFDERELAIIREDREDSESNKVTRREDLKNKIN